MIAKAIQTLLEISAPKTFNIDGITYSTDRLHHVKPDFHRMPAPINLNTLTGLIDYTAHNPDQHDPENFFFWIENYCTVHLTLPADPDNQWARTILATAHAIDLIPTGGLDWAAPDRFIPLLLSRFVDSDDRPLLLSIFGNLAKNAEIRFEDDGITPRITTTKGVSMKGEQKIPVPVILRPYRTFREIIQPQIPHTIRIKVDGDIPAISLFDASGESWKNDTIRMIKSWIDLEMGERGNPNIPVIA